MRNRAKCRLCNTVIESFHSEDHVICKCNEISVYGGNAMRCAANNWHNFMRVDDEGNEIVVKVKDKDENPIKTNEKLSKTELIAMLHELIKSIEALPTHAMTAPVTNYDLSAVLSLLLAIFRSQED